jgi:PadR family transcriptional regulator AphA
VNIHSVELKAKTMPREGGVSPQPVLLGLLMTQPKHGYELYQEFSRELGRVWEIGQSQLYAQLKQLEETGLVSVQTEPQPSRPPRKVYHLTAQGQATFVDWVHQPTPYLRHLRVEFLARLFFYQRLSLPGLEDLVAAQVAVCRLQVERFERLAAEAEDTFQVCVLEFRQGQLEAVIRWLDRCLEVL